MKSRRAGLPIATDYAVMDAKLVSALPEGTEWQYEPKWDGFRCLAFKDGDRIELRSKSGQPLGRYFPDVVDALRALAAPRCVIDGEIVVPVGNELSFDELLIRIHPAASRVMKLAHERPALFVAFDLLVDAGGHALVDLPLSQRRAALEGFAADEFPHSRIFRLSTMTRTRADVDAWFNRLGIGLDGIIAKRVDLPYQSGLRTGMQKYKRMRTADCVVGGFRYGSKTALVGSLLLGLYADDGLLHHVGFTSNLPSEERASLTTKLESLIGPPGFTGRAPGGPSRWSREPSAAWQPLRSEMVVEVQYDHFSGARFRHGTKFLRWRPDKAVRQCTLSQVSAEAEVAVVALSR